TPIQELEQAAERLAEGRHDGQRQDSLRQDSLRTDTGAREIKALARSFNDMATRVRIYQTGLERMVEDRTAELRIAKEEAEAAARAKSEFLAMMSHEVRTPLNGVVGVAELLSRRSLDPDSRQLVSTIRQSGSALTELLNDILDISRIEAGKLSFEMRDFDPRALVQGLVALMEHAARKKGLSFDLAVDRDLPQMLRGDPARLRQVLLNLVGNAVKFTETGGVKVEVSLLAEVEGTVELCFSVRDTGIGVPKDLRDRLFQPFSQLEAERSARFGGAGLGLAISRRLVEGMGGEIYHVSLDPEPGSCFVVELPFSIGDPEALCVTALDADGASPGSHCPPLRLLLIEDEPVNQQVLLSFLEADGHQVTLAEEGRSGLELALTHSYDLILTDLRLPGLSGIEVAERIQAAQGGATPPII
ncbi:MAG: ATP-binding protein, partial [Rhodospirillaceae bacterium]